MSLPGFNFGEAGDEILSLFRLGSKKYFDEAYHERKRQRRTRRDQSKPVKPKTIEEYIIRLRLLRRQANVSQLEMAGRVKTTQSAISRFECGLTNPTVNFLTRYARAVKAEIFLHIQPKKEPDRKKDRS